MSIFEKKCVSVVGKGVKPFSKNKAKEFVAEVSGWELSRDAKRISKEFTFRDFRRTMRFIDRAASLAMTEEHYPDIHIFCDRVIFDLWTPSIDGLSENDFIVAAKIDKLKAMDVS